MKRIVISGAALALAVTGVGIGSADPGSPAGGTGTIACGDGTVTWDPTTIWPPNHKMQTVNIGYIGNDDTQYDTSSIVVDAVTHDQFLPDGSEMNGSGNTDVDVAGIGNNATGEEGSAIATTAGVRQERSGREQDGRTYTITVTCSDYSSLAPGVSDQTDTVSFTVDVPHDQRRIKDES